MTKNLVKIDIYLSGIRGGGMAVSVRIEIRGLQRTDAKEEWAENKTVAVGICRKHGDGYAVIYEERTEAGTVRTKLQLEKDRLCICRSGVIGQELLLVFGETHDAPYQTPFGTIALRVQTNDVRTEFSAASLFAHAAYVLLAGEDAVSENEVEIRIRF